mmetsp:Transcript_81173/g.262351  ORF Transcript_81173/g.262351 Transcript_81173/m.262351 type:complete len:265 (-) Transcript_81173:538-1332(-)
MWPRHWVVQLGLNSQSTVPSALARWFQSTLVRCVQLPCFWHAMGVGSSYEACRATGDPGPSGDAHTASGTDAGAEAEVALELEERAAAWIEEHPTFELTLSDAKLKRAACPVFPFLYGAALTDDKYGLNFTREIRRGDSIADLQEALDFMFMQHIQVPGFDAPEKWHASARSVDPSFRSGDEGQHIKIESWDGVTLQWIVDSKHFCALRCERDDAPKDEVPWQGSAASSASLGAPSERRSQLRCEARGEFRGILRFRLPVRLEA